MIPFIAVIFLTRSFVYIIYGDSKYFLNFRSIFMDGSIDTITHNANSIDNYYNNIILFREVYMKFIGRKCLSFLSF